jgi:hypothetical protein
LLEQIVELHQLVRTWAEAGSKFGPVPSPVSGNGTIAYLDLMFAYGMARLGAVQQSATLAEAARVALEPFPAESDKGITGRFLFKAFMHRIDQAVAGHPPSDRLPPTLYDELDEIDKTSKGVAHSPHGMAHFGIVRMLLLSRILEPFERTDPYKKFTTAHEGWLKSSLYQLIGERDPQRLANRIRELYQQEGPPDRVPAMTEGQFRVLIDCLPLSGRVGAGFAAELLRLVPDALRQSFRKQKDLLHKQANLLECGLHLAGHFGHRDLAAQLADAFAELVATKPDDSQLELVNRVTGTCVRVLRNLDMRTDLDSLLRRLHAAVLGCGSLPDLRAKAGGRPEQWLKAVQALQNIAGGWLALGLADQASPILDEARAELLLPPGNNRTPHDSARLLGAYIAAVGHGPAGNGLERMAELFRKIDPARVTNAFVTAPFYSRLHLTVAEEVVLAALQMLSPAPSLAQT